MLAVKVLVAGLLALTALAIVPTGHAEVQPCPETTVQCCPPTEMYCCSVLACKPVSCPAERVGVDEVLALTRTHWVYGGPHAEVTTTSGCEATICESPTSCWDPACSDGTATCCTVGPVMSNTPCACAPLPTAPTVAEPAVATSIPLPSVGAALEPDCSVSVTEAWTCPAGLVGAPVHYDAGPAQVAADLCFIQCACMPFTAPAAAPQPAPATAVPCESPLPGGCGCLGPGAMPCQALQCPAEDVHLPPPLPSGGDASIATPIPSADVQTTSDCHVDVTLSFACPPGFWTQQARLTEGPATVNSTDCAPMCECIPLEANAASANLPPIGPPCPGMGGCCGVEPPEGGCGGLPVPSPPSCPAASANTSTLKPIGPIDPSFDGIAATTTPSCTATVTEHDGFLACPHNWVQRDSTTVVGPATVNSQMCEPEIECACDPLLAPLSAPVCAPQSVTSMEVTVTLRQDCSVLVDVHDQVTCKRPGWWPGTFDRSVGGEEVRVTFCLPEVAAASASSSLQPPIGVTFVVCVRGPCPPEVWCAPRYADELGVVTYEVDRSCDLTVSQDPAPCEAWHYDSTTVGPATLRRQQCDPGVQP